MGVQGRGARHDNEPRDQVGEKASGDDIDARRFQLALGDALLDNGSLQVELHPWGDCGAD
jgi:hypothetical protein